MKFPSTFKFVTLLLLRTQTGKFCWTITESSNKLCPTVPTSQSSIVVLFAYQIISQQITTLDKIRHSGLFSESFIYPLWVTLWSRASQWTLNINSVDKLPSPSSSISSDVNFSLCSFEWKINKFQSCSNRPGQDNKFKSFSSSLVRSLVAGWN